MVFAAVGQDFAYAFLSILFEGAPFILLGTLISGFIDVYLPSGTLEKWLPKKTLPAVLTAGLLGIILPVCECAVVPVIRRLVKKGLPFSSALTYMLAAPIVNPITALSTYKAFSGQNETLVTALRMLMGYGVAVFAGLLLARFAARSVLKASVADSVEAHESSCCGGHHHDHDHDHHHHDDSCGHDHSHDKVSSEGKLVLAMRSALKDFADVAVYFVIGISLAAWFNVSETMNFSFIDQAANSTIGGPVVLMLMAFIISLCSTSDAFIAATLDKFTYGAKLAFMVYGPMMDVKLIFLYSTVLRKKAIFFLAVGLFLVIGALSAFWVPWFFETFNEGVGR